MNRDIKAIEIHYIGFRFHSRVEARRAISFDAANKKMCNSYFSHISLGIIVH